MRLRMAVLMILIVIMAEMMTVQAAPVKVPKDVEQMSLELGTEYSICPELIQAVCFKESSFNARAENGNCVGIMQVNPSWHQDRMKRLGVTDLYDTKGNMLVGVDYLAELAEQYEDISIALMVYNGDSRVEDAVDNAVGISEYAEEVLMISAEMERVNGK